MKTFVNVTLASFIAFGTAFTANAEMLDIYTDWGSKSIFGIPVITGGAQGAHNNSIMSGLSVPTTGAWFKDAAGESLYLTGPTFGLPFTTEAANAQKNGAIAFSANVNSLADSPYTAIQQAQIQSLYDHVYYSKAYNEDNFVPGQFVKDATYASLFGTAIQAILYSTTADGSFYVTQSNGKLYLGGSASGWTLTSDAYLMLRQWFSAINYDDWDSLDGYTENKVTVTSYDITYGSTNSKMFGVSAYNPPDDYLPPILVEPVTTPEPATMLIIGLGIAGLGLARRRKNK